ncbi:hypothetical protein XELAEV_18003441mg [Xenopus laevis]|nr:hypothetical protein XELAEV_18003441mg [Xenopus laevis]
MDLTEVFTILIHLMSVLYAGYCYSGDKAMNPSCNLEIIKTLEDYEYIQEGNIMIGGVITVNALVSRFRNTHSYDKFMLCLKAYQLLTKYLSSEGICIDFTIKIRYGDSHKHYPLYREIIQRSSTSVVIFCGIMNMENAENVHELSDLLSEKTFIFPSNWLYNSLALGYALTLLNGSLIFMQNRADYTKNNLHFRQFLESVHPSAYPDDKLLEDIWMFYHLCLSKDEKRNILHEFLYSQHLHKCTGAERLIDINAFDDEFHTFSIMVAVHTLAVVSDGLHYLQLHNQQNLGTSKVIHYKYQIHQLLKEMQIQFQGQLLKSFNDNGEFASPYQITNFYVQPNQQVTETRIGQYVAWAPRDQKLNITLDTIRWKTTNNEIPRAQCSQSCLPGFRKATKSGAKSCCYDCVLCSEGEISIVTGSSEQVVDGDDKRSFETSDSVIRSEELKRERGDLERVRMLVSEGKCERREEGRQRKAVSGGIKARIGADCHSERVSFLGVCGVFGRLLGDSLSIVKGRSHLANVFLASLTVDKVVDSDNCFLCSDKEWPNEKKNQCIPKSEHFLSYTIDMISVVFTFMSLFFFAVTAMILTVFIKYQDTPIVRANKRSLSFLLLVSIKLSFLSVFLFLGRPVDITCMLRNITFGITFSIAVSSLQAKTIMVCVAFKATKPGSSWRKWVGVKLSNSVVLFCSSIQIIICMTWLAISPPFQELDLHTYPGTIIIQCNEGSAIGFYSVIGYMGLLAAVSFVLAFLARTLPDSFNEAKYITFSMLLFCSVWITMIPAYLSTKGKNTVCVEIFAILTSSAGLLFCIFLPKCYTILFRPDINKKSNLFLVKT